MDQGFFGLVSSTPFDTITLVAIAPSFAGNDNFTVDNLALAAPVPEPGSIALTALGLAGLSVGLRRQRTGI